MSGSVISRLPMDLKTVYVQSVHLTSASGPLLRSLRGQPARVEPVEPEHILLGVLDEGKGLGCRILARTGGTLDDLRSDIVRRLTSREKVPTSDEIPFSPSCRTTSVGISRRSRVRGKMGPAVGPFYRSSACRRLPPSPVPHPGLISKRSYPVCPSAGLIDWSSLSAFSPSQAPLAVQRSSCSAVSLGITSGRAGRGVDARGRKLQHIDQCLQRADGRSQDGRGRLPLVDAVVCGSAIRGVAAGRV